jgi:hypothetical protein
MIDLASAPAGVPGRHREAARKGQNMKEGTVTVVEHGRDASGRPVTTETEMDRGELPQYLMLEPGD